MKIRGAQICVGRGETRQDAVDDAMAMLNGFFVGASSWAEYESVSAQYDKLTEEEGYMCILTAFYTRK